MKPICNAERVLLLLARLRVGLAVAGVAWLLGYSPSIGGRVVTGVLVLLVLVLDAAAGALHEPVTVSVGRRLRGGGR